ncbi:MAG: chemotaxis protein CheW [Proteobacteria bacterium]|nr:chemotaxis protein CheW [Pseudomonadota bacterium]
MTELAVIDHHDQNLIASEKLVTMKIDNQLFGIPILQVQDIVEPRMITPVPLAPSAIAGVMNLRGRIVTVINLRRCLGLQDRNDQERRMSITVEYNGDLYTLLVDAIGDVCDLPSRDFESPPATLSEKLRQLCTGIFRLKGDLLVVLDVDRVLDADMLLKSPPVTLKQRAPKSDAARAKKRSKPEDEDKTAAAEKASAKSAEKSPSATAGAKVLEFGEPGKVGGTLTKSGLTSKADDPAPKPAPKASAHIMPDAGTSLFERLGGDDAVEASVDIFFSKITGDALLKPFFTGTNMDQLSFKLRIFLTGAFGGPQAYSGRSLREAHAQLVAESGLNEKHFAAFVRHLKSTLDELGIEANMIGEVMAIVDKTRIEVLNL